MASRSAQSTPVRFSSQSASYVTLEAPNDPLHKTAYLGCGFLKERSTDVGTKSTLCEVRTFGGEEV